MKFNKIMLAVVSTMIVSVSIISIPALANDTSAGMNSASDMAAATAGKSPAAADRVNKQLLAAAEPFENLTEMAFTSTWSKIDHTIGDAKIAAAGARSSLAQDEVGKLDAHLAAMKSARQKRDRADLALSSIEVYRVLVSSVTDSAKIPPQVSLLDYSGFRYDADLKSSPIRWDDMAKTMDFAHQQWAVIAPKLKGIAVANQFEKAIDGMDRAVREKDTALAASSVKSESDLVDELEKYFSAH